MRLFECKRCSKPTAHSIHQQHFFSVYRCAVCGVEEPITDTKNLKGVYVSSDLKTFKVKSHNKKTPNVEWTVTFQEGRWRCSCPHYEIRLRFSTETCKHIDEIVEGLNV